MNEEMQVAGYSQPYVITSSATGVDVLVTPTQEAYVRLETKQGSAGWVYRDTVLVKEPTTLSYSGFPLGNGAARIKLFGGIGFVDLQFAST